MQKYFSVILFTKLLLAAGTYAALLVVAHVLNYAPDVEHLIWLSGVTMIFDSFHLTMYGVLRAIGDLRYEAASITVSQLLTLVLGSIFLFAGLPLIFLILAFTIPSAFNALYVGVVLYKKYHIRFAPAYDRVMFRSLAIITIPFALAAIFARVYSYADSIILSKLLGEMAVGWYSIPYKITYAFQFIPLALVAAMYPRFSEYFVKDRKRLAFLFERGMKYLMLISFPIAVGIGVLAKDIILFLYTDAYAPSILPLQVLIVSLVFSYASFPIGAFLNACNRQVAQTTIVGIVMVVNIVLNLLLIPRIGVLGAASAALFGNILLTLVGYMFVPRITPISHRFIGTSLVQVALAATIMGASVWAVGRTAPLAVAIAVGAVVYPVALFFVGAVTREQLVEATQLLRKRA